MFDKQRKDEELYARALQEAEGGTRRDGLWGEALAKSGGDVARAKSLYIEYLVQTMRVEREEAAAKKHARLRHDVEDGVYLIVGIIALLIVIIFLTKPG